MIYSTNDIGCFFDGAFGFEFNAGRIIDLAIEHGYTPHYQAENGEDEEALNYEVDDAEVYLNEHTIIPEYAYWSWLDGDFGLWLHCESCSEVIDHNEPCLFCEGAFE